MREREQTFFKIELNTLWIGYTTTKKKGNSISKAVTFIIGSFQKKALIEFF